MVLRSGRKRNALMGEGQRSWPRKVAGLELDDVETGWPNKVIDLAIGVTASPDAFADRREALLPRLNFGVGGQPVLNEQQLTIRPQHALHLGKRVHGVWDAAERPCHHPGVEAPVVKWEVLRGSTEQLDREGQPAELATGHAEKLC